MKTQLQILSTCLRQHACVLLPVPGPDVLLLVNSNSVGNFGRLHKTSILTEARCLQTSSCLCWCFKLSQQKHLWKPGLIVTRKSFRPFCLKITVSTIIITINRVWIILLLLNFLSVVMVTHICESANPPKLGHLTFKLG